MKNIAVFFGGESVERDVSIITGLLTLNSIDKEKFNPVPIYVSEKGEWLVGDTLADIDTFVKLDEKKLKKVTLLSGCNYLYEMRKNKFKELFPIACAINCCHGGSGENGDLYGLLRLHNIPAVSPPTMASAIAMDKEITKVALKGIRVKTLPCQVIKSTLDADIKKIKFPVVVKPASLGSSIGIKVVESQDKLPSAVAAALRFDDKAVIEPKLSGFTEINCACYRADDEIFVSECEKPMGKTDVLTFDDKYNGGRRQFPARIDKKISDKIKRTTKKIYTMLNFSGIIRIDYFVTENGDVFVNEINSVPGSMAYYLFCNNLSEFSVMLTRLIAQAEKEFSVKSTLVKKFGTSLLTISGSKGAKRL